MTTILISSIIVIAIILIALAIRLEKKDNQPVASHTGEDLVKYAEEIKKIAEETVAETVAELIKEQETPVTEAAPKKKKSRPRKKSAPKKKED